jgi:ABC-type transport system substrate-binding protein
LRYKDALVAAGFGGLSQQASNVLNPGYFTQKPNVTVYEYNPDKAKKLIAEAAFPKGLDAAMLYYSGDPWKIYAPIIQEQLCEVGIQMNLNMLDRASMEPIWTGGSAETALKRAGTWANGFISGSAAIEEFHKTWDKIASYATAAGRNPDDITKASLAFMAINDDKARAVQAVEAYTMRYYGRIRTPVEPVSIVGSDAQCAEKIEYFFSKGIDTLIIGVADPDPRQLDLFGEKVLPQVKR